MKDIPLLNEIHVIVSVYVAPACEFAKITPLWRN